MSSSSEMRPEFFVAGGTVPPGAPSYVERTADRELFDALRAGEYCYVLNSRQMGKSSLAVRTIGRLKEIGVRTAFLDLTRLGGATVTPEQWYAGLLVEIGKSLGLRAEAAALLRDARELGPTQRLLHFLSEIVLQKIDGPIVVMIDEIDATRSLPFSTDELFAGIRQLNNGRASDPELNRLTFCLLGAALPSDLIRDARITPFNVGRRIELLNFTADEALPFAAALGPNGDSKLRRIQHWTGGHPFLTQSLCASLAIDGDVDDLVRERYLDTRARDADSNLVDVGNRLLGRGDPNVGERERADALDLYNQMRKGGVPDDEANAAAARIKMSGIAQTEGGVMRVRNRIYEKAFDADWIRENMPGQELRRQRRAYRLGVVRTALAAGAILSVIATLMVLAILNAGRANRAETAARQQRDEARYEAYVASIRSLPLSLELNNLHEIDRVVRAQASFPGRGWEWGFWHHLANRSLYSVNMDDFEFGEPAISRDGRTLAVMKKTGDGVGVFDLAEGRFLRVIPLKRPREGSFFVRFYDNERKLFLIGSGTYITVDFLDNREIAERKSGALTHTSSLYDENHVLGFHKGSLVKMDIDTGVVRTILPLDNHYRHSCVYSPDRRYAFWIEERMGSPFAHLVIYETAGWRKVGEADPLEAWFAPYWAPDGKTIAIPMAEGQVRLVEAPSGKTLWTKKLTTGFILSVDFSSDGKEMIVAGLDRIAKRWSISRDRARHLDDYLDASYAFFIPGEERGKDRIATLYFEVRAYDPAKEIITPEPEPGRHWYQTMLSEDGTFVGWTGTELDILDLRTPTLPRRSHPFKSEPIRFDQRGLTYCRRITGEERREIGLVNTGKMLHRLEVDTSREGFVYDRSPDGRAILVYNTVFDLKSGAILGKVATDGPATQARFSPDSRHLLVSDKSGNERLWRFGDSSSASAFSNDGTRVVLAQKNDHAVVLDTATGRLVGDLVGHTNPVVAVAWSPDDRRIATFGEDKTVRLWDAATGREMCILGRHTVDGYDIRFMPDGRSLVSVDADGEVKYWMSDPSD
ncbi:hypothetical protein EON81_17985 [bacterium]|nr:MAG: hypothetical protein EON81_17985 [bacterium]